MHLCYTSWKRKDGALVHNVFDGLEVFTFSLWGILDSSFVSQMHLPGNILIQLMVVHCLWQGKKLGNSMVGSPMRCLLFTLEPPHCICQVSSRLKVDNKIASPAAQNGPWDVGGMRGR